MSTHSSLTDDQESNAVLPHVHVEVTLQDTDAEELITRAELEQHMCTYLKEHYPYTVRNQEYLDLTSQDVKFLHITHVHSIRVTDVERDDVPFFQFDHVQLFVHAFILWKQQDTAGLNTYTFKSSANAQAKTTSLPHESLQGLWESLDFAKDQNINTEQILGSIVRTVNLLHHPNGISMIRNINRLFLFHGPPGCGKSSLCRAIAQKLSIRLNCTFHNGGKLFEINTQDLLSKYYSESGKLISEMFEKVLKMAQDEKQLICVLIDEVESIAGSRQRSTANGECADTVRATNQLLTALDRIRAKSNVIVFCTSNLLSSIDTAFLDRVYDSIAVPLPGLRAIYTILSRTLNALLDAGAIASTPITIIEELQGIHALVDNRSRLPLWHQLYVWEAFFPNSPGLQVREIARDCVGMSGRHLTKLPLLAITKYSRVEPCTLEAAVVALEHAVNQSISVGCGGER